ncbi:MAG: putative DNA binding domain-containing protein [Bacteroidota bacterium]|nr:putative DNA binding domain-containing protein [Bacteroidota bacterium]
MTETNRIEYKQELTEGLEKEVIAFLNYHEGGVLYIGIDKTGKAIGVKDADGDMLKIKDRLKNNISPSCMGLFEVVLETKKGKDIIKVNIASGPEKPYYIKKQGMSERGCYIRIGTAAEPMPNKMIERLFSKRTRNSIGKIQSARQDLKFNQLKIYYEGTGVKLNSKFAANLELLTEDKKYNYAAYLLADINNTSIKVAKYKGLNRVDLIESNEFGHCSLVKATKQVLDKMDLENKTLTKITSRERKTTRLWDPIALREAVINALVHNDYSNEVPPKFEFFADRIEITSAGGLPEGMNQEEFFVGFSVPRNKEIMRIFKDLDLVEHLGSGVPRILESYSRDCFKFTDNFVRMSFPSTAPVAGLKGNEKNLSGGQIGGQIGGQMGGQIGGQIGGAIEDAIGGAIDGLPKRQIEILRILQENNKISRKGLSDTLGINESAILKHIEQLKEKGYLVRIGGTRGYWKIRKKKK